MTSRRDSTALDRGRSKHRNLLVRLAGAIAVVCLWSTCAYAQINPFRGYKGPVLTKADLDQGIQAADKLLKTDGGKVGTSETWTSPTSGNSGTVTILSTFERKGNTCRAMRSVVDYKDGTKRTWTLNVCRLPNGDWKIA
jgi:surface antigen